jgi:4-hydroxy-tetrahydrodipicolinate reductase
VPDPLRILLSGATGRMGRAVAALASADPRFALVAGLGRGDGGGASPVQPLVAAPEEAGDRVREAAVVVDFSSPAYLRRLLEAQGKALAGRGLVVGTTGLGPEEERLLAAQAERSAVLRAANFSVGVNLLVAFTERAARALGDEYDVEIVEAHHRRKADAPSGTALALGEAVAVGRGATLADVRVDGRSGETGERPRGEIGFHALRGGDVVGDHTVAFIGDRERVEFSHRATDRALFAEGALRAARWIAGRPAGRYTMRDVLGLD